MKRCPACNRVESDEALKFCRVDGATLVNDSSSINGEAGTVQLVSSRDASEVHTSNLPQYTNANVNCTTAPTTVLPPPPPAPGTTRPKSRRTAIIIAVLVTAVVTAVSAVVVNSYLSKLSTKAIESVAVMPFVNDSGDENVEYLSDGMTDTLISNLSQLPNLNVKAHASVFRYKGKEQNPKTIGRDLNVQAILNGRFAQRGDRL